jgi:hypothetical protein
MPRQHVAIIDAHAAEALLAGRKRVETRFSRTRRAPFGRANRHDIIHFKVSGGAIIGTCSVTRVRTLADLTPSRITALRRELDRAVAAPYAYWAARRHCRYATLLWLSPLAAPPPGLRIPRQYGTAWFTLPDPADRKFAPSQGLALRHRLLY